MSAEAKLSVIEQVMRLLSSPNWEFSRNVVYSEDGLPKVVLTIKGTEEE